MSDLPAVIRRATARLKRANLALKYDPKQPQDFGTAVHTRLKREVNDRSDSSFIAEESYLKAEQEFGEGARRRYGLAGTLRVDVLEKVADGTVCVYDIKTGRSSFSFALMKEIVSAVHRHFNNVHSYIIIEVRPD